MSLPTLEYAAPPTPSLFMASDARVRLIMGPVGSGKSTACCMEIARRAQAMPKSVDGFRRSRWAIIRNTRDQLKKTTFNTWIQWFPDGMFGRWKESDRVFYLEFDDVRAEILFLPLDSPDDQRRLLSLELTGVFINEAREVPLSLIIAAFSRTGRYPSKAMCKEKYWHGLIMDTNPPDMDSELHEKFEDEKPEGWEVFKQPGGLDPAAENRENLPDTYYEDMMNGATEDWIRVHVHGKYGRSKLGRAVYENAFRHEFHVAPSPLMPIKHDEYPLTIGLDFGRTPAAVIAQRDHRGRVLLLDELFVKNIGLDNFLLNHLKPFLARKYPQMKCYVVGDPAGWSKSQINELSCADVLKMHGFIAVRAATNDIDKRIEAVERLLMQQVDGKAVCVVSPICKQVIRGFDGGYKYKRKASGEYDVTPSKDDASHLADAVQYMALGIGGGGGALTARDARPVVRANASGWT